LTGDRAELARRWPQFALHIAVLGAHLEAPTDAQLDTLAQHAARPEAVLPFTQSHFVTWIQGRTSGEIERQRAARVHANRDLLQRSGWTLDLAVIVDGEPVGMQSLSGLDGWPKRRVLGTTSWLIGPAQRRGLGTRCRAAVLELGFAHLGAQTAKSWALEDNRASAAVSCKLGYRVVDRHQIIEFGREHCELVYELARDDWLRSSARARYAPVISHVGVLAGLLAN
jgi:RimJ/RimL family protein N-acetyltransferase